MSIQALSPSFPLNSALGLLAASLGLAALGLLSPAPAAPGPGDLRLVDVLGELDRGGRPGAGTAGGVALQTSPASPARFFREAPSDRPAGAWAPAVNERRQVYLEDAWAPVAHDRDLGSVQWLMAPPDALARRATYFVDGDLWVDAFRVQSFVLGGYQDIEIVARGNIVIADDVLAAQGTHITFTALHADDGSGGDIVLEDALFGSLKTVEADLYAEGAVRRADHARGAKVLGDIAEGVVGR